VNFAKKEAKYRQQQQAELHALLKRIECRRKEHIKQRSLDSKRLLQRNRNVQAVLESKQVVESQKLFVDIKKSLVHGAYITPLIGAPASANSYSGGNGNGNGYGYGGGGRNSPGIGITSSRLNSGRQPSSAGGGGGGGGGYDKDMPGYYTENGEGNDTTFYSEGESNLNLQGIAEDEDFNGYSPPQRNSKPTSSSSGKRAMGGYGDNEDDDEGDGEGGGEGEEDSRRGGRGFGRPDDDIAFDPPFMNEGGPSLAVLADNADEGLF
jgi:hypothetical protein